MANNMKEISKKISDTDMEFFDGKMEESMMDSGGMESSMVGAYSRMMMELKWLENGLMVLE